MEKYSIIDLIEDDAEEEDDDHEVDHKKKRRHLAVSILNFVANRPVIEENEPDEKEEDALSLLFTQPQKEVGDQIEIMAEHIDPIILAKQVVEDRIIELSEEVDDQSTEGSVKEDNLEKIQALEEVIDYLGADDLNVVEFNQVNQITKIKDGTETPAAVESVETDQVKIVSEEKVIKQAAQKSSRPESSHHQSAKEDRPKHRESANQTDNNSEPTTKTKNQSKDYFNTESNKSTAHLDEEESLTHTRELIKNLYVRKEIPSEPKIEKIVTKKPEVIRTAEPERVVLERPMEIINETPKPPPQYHYLDIAKKISFDNMSLNQFFNKNNFDQKSRIRIISDILRGEKPAKVIEKEMKKRGKFKNLIKSYSKDNLANQTQVNNQPKESYQPTAKELIADRSSFKQSSINARIWLLIIIILILLIIFFIILKQIIG